MAHPNRQMLTSLYSSTCEKQEDQGTMASEIDHPWDRVWDYLLEDEELDREVEEPKIPVLRRQEVEPREDRSHHKNHQSRRSTGSMSPVDGREDSRSTSSTRVTDVNQKSSTKSLQKAAAPPTGKNTKKTPKKPGGWFKKKEKKRSDASVRSSKSVTSFPISIIGGNKGTDVDFENDETRDDVFSEDEESLKHTFSDEEPNVEETGWFFRSEKKEETPSSKPTSFRATNSIKNEKSSENEKVKSSWLPFPMAGDAENGNFTAAGRSTSMRSARTRTRSKQPALTRSSSIKSASEKRLSLSKGASESKTKAKLEETGTTKSWLFPFLSDTDETSSEDEASIIHSKRSFFSGSKKIETDDDDDGKSWLFQMNSGDDSDSKLDRPARQTKHGPSTSSSKTAPSWFSRLYGEEGDDTESDQESLFKRKGSKTKQASVNDGNAISFLPVAYGGEATNSSPVTSKFRRSRADKYVSTKRSGLGRTRSDGTEREKSTKSRHVEDFQPNMFLNDDEFRTGNSSCLKIPSFKLRKSLGRDRQRSAEKASIVLTKEGSWRKRRKEVDPEPESSLLFSLFTSDDEGERQNKSMRNRIRTGNFGDDSSLLMSVFGYERPANQQSPEECVDDTSTRATSVKNKTRKRELRYVPPADVVQPSPRTRRASVRSRSPPRRGSLLKNSGTSTASLFARKGKADRPPPRENNVVGADPFAYSRNSTSFNDEVSKARKELFHLQVDNSWTAEDEEFLWDHED